MHILMQVKPDLYEMTGGEETQVSKTREHLIKLGVTVDISRVLEPNLSGYDVLHLFQLTAPSTYVQALNAKRQGVPVALSTIYWSHAEYRARGRYLSWPKRLFNQLTGSEQLRESLGQLYWWITGRTWSNYNYLGRRRQILQLADIWLPNARMEVEILEAEHGVRRPFLVVPNAADVRFATADPGPFIHQYGLSDFVMYGGRIDDKKNVLGLIRALRGTGISLVIVGPGNIYQQGYVAACHRAADNYVHFLGPMTQTDLACAYAAAKVHVLPSWFDVPGLSSLEAGLAGCNVVTTDRGATREYFGDLAWYCDPGNPISIRRAVLAALEAPRDHRLRDHILVHYTWVHAAQRTLEAYTRVVDG